jgi:tetratricopeptide (TPR) repeat protein
LSLVDSNQVGTHKRVQLPTVMAMRFIPGGLPTFFAKARIIRLFVALAISTTAISAFRERGIAQQAETGAILGAVKGANGNSVADAVVRLVQGDAVVAVTRTDVHGSFAFSRVQPGKYSLRAEKDEMYASQTVSTGGAETQILLTIYADAARTQNMDFTDKPNFTVAGITDWTAVGGHGSDASLRTSETLARKAATLSPDGTSVVPSSSDAEGALRAAAAASPESFAPNRELGEFCLRKGSYREALIPLEAAYRIDPANHDNEYDLALAYKEAGDLKRAQEHVRHLLTEQNAAKFHRLAGDINEAMGDALSAEREYETAVHLDPSEANDFALGAELLLHRAVWPAIEVFRKGAAAYPRSGRMLSALGVSLFASAQYGEAAQRLCEAADLSPTNPAPYTFLGEIEIAAPAPLDCVEEKLSRFAQAQPHNARANYYYAMAILKRQRVPANVVEMESAQLLLAKAIEIDPKFGEAYLQLGILSVDRKDYRQAIDLFTKAIEANPQVADAHYRLGVAYQRTGAVDKARQEFARHDEIEKSQAQDVEQQRRKVKQFMVVLQGQSASAK